LGPNYLIGRYNCVKIWLLATVTARAVCMRM
jgi:hypothetical protein